MTEDESKSGTNAAVVIAIVLFLLVPCAIGLVYLGGIALVRLTPVGIPLPPVPGANAPPMGGATINVNDLKWSQNLFDAAEVVLTFEKYDQIKLGMTYEEVLSTLEIPENRRPDDIDLVGPDSNVELKWFGGPNDSQSITVKMKGKTVIDKTQSGLQ